MDNLPKKPNPRIYRHKDQTNKLPLYICWKVEQ